jgi:predicted transcriptional regulator of viral defense system
MLSVFNEPSPHIQIQLSRWKKQGKLSQVRRGWYIIEEPYRKMDLPSPVISNSVVHPSYLSLEWALQYYDMIPEFVPNLTSITSERGITFKFKNKLYVYCYVKPLFFTGYSRIKFENHKIFIACPEKSLMDKIYLYVHSNRFSLKWLKELRLQNMQDFDLELFGSFSEKTQMKGLKKAVQKTINYIKGEIP